MRNFACSGCVIFFSLFFFLPSLTVLPLSSQVRQQNIVGKGARENVVKTIYEEGGARGFYRGLGPVVSTIVPKVAVRFSAFHQFRALTERAAGTSNFATSLLAGMGAGATEAIVVVTPSEVVKIRQQEKGNANRGQLATLRVLLREGGVGALYRGIGATVIRQSGQQGCKFAFFYYIKDLLHLQGSSGDLIGGALANCVGAVLNTPLDVVKTRIQRQVGFRVLFPSFFLFLPAVEHFLSPIPLGLRRIILQPRFLFSLFFSINCFDASFNLLYVEGTGQRKVLGHCAVVSTHFTRGGIGSFFPRSLAAPTSDRASWSRPVLCL